MTNTKNAAVLSWCRDEATAGRLAKLFANNLTASYISHSELQGPRAVSPGRWVPGIGDVLRNEIVGRVGNALDPVAGEATYLSAGITLDGKEVGVMLVTFSRAAPVAFAILEDIVVSEDARGHGIGTQALAWLDAECRERKITRQFLESGIENHDAHELFVRKGFEKVSVVMMKTIHD